MTYHGEPYTGTQLETADTAKGMNLKNATRRALPDLTYRERADLARNLPGPIESGARDTAL